MTESHPGNIGHFRILSKLGQGGMGNVYRAMHGTLERTVALKVLPPEFCAHPEYVSRFVREARVVASLSHENIIQIYDSGEIGGQYYIAMELIEGGNLLNVAEARKKIDEKEGLRLMLQAARGLGVAHAKGLIHRDIKPENLLLGTDGVVKLVDFGLVADSGSASQLTQAGTCLGTPMYMSAEQADGEHTDGRSDLYSLGATFYRVFTGRPPFVAATVMNTLFKQKFEKPPDPQSIRPDLSLGTSHLLLHLLAKRREDRPADAKTLIGMIEDLLAGKEIPAPPPFVPLIPKPRAEEPEASIAPDGETAVLFAGSGTRRKSVAETGGVSTLKAAMILFALCAGVIFFIASNGRRDPVSEPVVQVAPVKPVALTEGELLERVASGDQAFREGRIREAREIYLGALMAVPNHVELMKRRDRADRRIKFDIDMSAAEKFEKQGKLEDALTRYGEALALDEEHIAQERIDRVKAALEQSKKPVAEFSAAPGPTAQELAATELALELERAAKNAQDFLLLQNYERAEEAFLRAAELAPDSRKVAFQEKAAQCRRLKLLAQARAAEANNELAVAEAAYLKALELANDEQTIAQLNALRQRMKPPEDKNLLLYKEAMREGQEAMDKSDFKLARVKFGVAMGLKPELSTPGSRLNELEARETLIRADEARARGDLETARSLYQETLAKSQLLEAEVQQRLKELGNAPSRAALAIDKAIALVRQTKNEEAVKALEEALRADVDSLELSEAKNALESALKARDLLASIQSIETLAVQRFREAAEIDDDEFTKKMGKAASESLKLNAEKEAQVLSDFVSKDFKKAIDRVAEVQKSIVTLITELTTAADNYQKLYEKAEDKVGVKIPGLPKIGIGGDRKKSEKYRVLVEGFKVLINRCKDLQK